MERTQKFSRLSETARRIRTPEVSRARVKNAVEVYEGTALGPFTAQMAGVALGASGTGVIMGRLLAKRTEIFRTWADPAAVGDNDVVTARNAFIEKRGVEALQMSSPFREGGIPDPTKIMSIPVDVWMLSVIGLGAWLGRDSQVGGFAQGAFAGNLAASVATRIQAGVVDRALAKQSTT